MTRHRLPWLDTPWEPEALRDEPIEELFDRAEQFSDATEGLFDRLGAIRASTSGSGIALTVTLDGRLVELTLSDAALRLGGAKLAAEIHRLTTEAAADALSQGIAVLTPVIGIDVAEQLAAATGLDKMNAADSAAAEVPPVKAPVEATVEAAPARPRRPAPAVDDEDFSTLETWAVRD
ncbi:hypothetical protein [Labedaea rhizosphaerae]|uniref:YbaB/EbfC DNA-binding family protein n=1 Tax=Labedaea rhizosphaerae TaxID=598644 RepID=A0A4R6S9F0_LABRH|nr:hypothetical protein [Labedaea rhizosphaerae]TDP96074.1 hypothetical protein EV186_10454 [Labedaea rhizosphaerae]